MWQTGCGHSAFTIHMQALTMHSQLPCQMQHPDLQVIARALWPTLLLALNEHLQLNVTIYVYLTEVRWCCTVCCTTESTEQGEAPVLQAQQVWPAADEVPHGEDPGEAAEQLRCTARVQCDMILSYGSSPLWCWCASNASTQGETCSWGAAQHGPGLVPCGSVFWLAVFIGSFLSGPIDY